MGEKLTILSHSAEQIIVKIPLLVGTGHVDVWYQGKMYEGPVFTYDSILVVTTIAGTTVAGEVNGKGLNARFWGPVGIALDHQRNIYVAEEGGSSIRKIDTAGNVTTLAGPADETPGFMNGVGAAARFSSPLGLCMGSDGYLYVADEFNYRVRKVSTSGIVSTFGAPWDGRAQDGGIDGPDSIATFDTPYGVTCDQHGNIYVADICNNKIRKIDPTGTVSTFAGGDYYHYGQKDGVGSGALFSGPSAVTADLSGNLYVIDGDLLRKIAPDGTVTTLFGPNAPSIISPSGLFSAAAPACDKYGNLYFAIFGGVIKMTPNGTLSRYAIGGVGGSIDGPLPTATFDNIVGMAVDDAGTLYFTDNNRVRKISWQ